MNSKDLEVLARARTARTEPASVYYNSDVEYGPIDERVIAMVVAIFTLLIAAGEECRPILFVWRDELSIVYPDGSVMLDVGMDDDDTVDVTLIDDTAPIHLQVRGLAPASPAVYAETVLAIRRNESSNKTGVLIPVHGSTRMCRLSSLGDVWVNRLVCVLSSVSVYGFVFDPLSGFPYNERATRLCGSEVCGDAFLFRVDGAHVGNETVTSLLARCAPPLHGMLDCVVDDDAGGVGEHSSNVVATGGDSHTVRRE